MANVNPISKVPVGPTGGAPPPTITGTAVPNVNTGPDPKKVAFGAWLMKVHPEFSGLGGANRATKIMPQLLAEFEPVWQTLQTSKGGVAPAATGVPAGIPTPKPMAPPPGTPLPLSGKP